MHLAWRPHSLILQLIYNNLCGWIKIRGSTKEAWSSTYDFGGILGRMEKLHFYFESDMKDPTLGCLSNLCKTHLLFLMKTRFCLEFAKTFLFERTLWITLLSFLKLLPIPSDPFYLYFFKYYGPEPFSLS